MRRQRRGVDARGVLREGGRAPEHLPRARVNAPLWRSEVADDGFVLRKSRFVIARVNQILIIFSSQTVSYCTGEETIVCVDTLGAHNAQMHKLGVSARSEDPE